MFYVFFFISSLELFNLSHFLCFAVAWLWFLPTVVSFFVYFGICSVNRNKLVVNAEVLGSEDLGLSNNSSKS